MAIRNIRGIGSRKPIPIFVWIPPQYNPTHKVEIYDADTGNTYDVTDIVIRGEYTWGVTETIGKFEFTIDNSAQTYLNIFDPYDEIRVYMDYGTSATTLRFKGVIERVSKKDYNLVLSGRGPATKYVGKNVSYSASSTARSTILSEVIAKYFTDLTTTNLGTDSTTTTVNYSGKPFWDVVEDICGQSNYGAYIDENYDFNYFEQGSKQNLTEAIVHAYNLVETGDFAPDASSVYNRVLVYGKETGGVPIIASAEDSTSQNIYGVRDLEINDEGITSVTQAQARADYELAQNKDPPTVGKVVSLGLPTIAPGEQLRISDPLNGLVPAHYDVFEYTHKFSNDKPFMTEVTIKKERTTIPRILKKRIKFESEVGVTTNPNEMENSIIYDFDDDVGTHSDTQIDDGVLSLTSGSSTGTWDSPVTSIGTTASAFEIRYDADDPTGLYIYLSIDGGANYVQIAGVAGSQTLTAGSDVRVRVRITSSTTRIKTLGIYYK